MDRQSTIQNKIRKAIDIMVGETDMNPELSRKI